MESKEIKARVIIEVVGSPKAHVEETLNKLIETIKSDSELVIEKKEVFEAVEVPELKLFSAFVEADIKFVNIEKLIGFCFDYTPTSIEVIEPMTFMLDARFLNCMLNDVVTKLHKYTMLIRNLDAEYAVLKKGLDTKK